jgi:hypothetical protein
MTRVRATALLALLTIAASCAAAAQDSGPPHIHLAFVPLPSAARLDVEKAAGALSEARFLQANIAPDDSPLAPCSLAGAALVAAFVNHLWISLEKDEPLSVPLGTNILGMFDREMKGGKIPRDDPGRAAEMLARVYIWRMWGINTRANTFVARSTQEQCLDLVLSTNQADFERRLSRALGVDDYRHYAAVEYYSPTIPRATALPWLGELGAPSLLTGSAASGDNPLAPCSLVRSLMMSSHVTTLWVSLTEGKIKAPAPDDPTLGRFASALAQGTVPRDDPAQATQITARLFGARMRSAATFIERYLAGSTQQECLDEVFQPGRIRVRLIKEGKFVPPDYY